MNTRHLVTKLARLNLSQAARDAVALKAEYRRENKALAQAGQAREILRRNAAVLGGTTGDRARLVTVNGIRVRA